MHEDSGWRPSMKSLSKPEARAEAPVTLQAITGLVPPEVREALIRECRPSLSARGGLAMLAARLTRTVFLAPLGWLLLAPLFAARFAPFLGRRYRLTNRRLLICSSLYLKALQEIPLAQIDEVRFDPASVEPFYRAGTLDIVSAGQVRLHLVGVPEPEGFRQAILNACSAWVPGKAKAFNPFLPASSIP